MLWKLKAVTVLWNKELNFKKSENLRSLKNNYAKSSYGYFYLIFQYAVTVNAKLLKRGWLNTRTQQMFLKNVQPKSGIRKKKNQWNMFIFSRDLLEVNELSEIINTLNRTQKTKRLWERASVRILSHPITVYKMYVVNFPESQFLLIINWIHSSCIRVSWVIKRLKTVNRHKLLIASMVFIK